MPPTLVLVNGFLGAGKTTLLVEAARRVRTTGKRAAVLTNDQGDALVDTAFAKAAGIDTAEITGGCFCCRFSEFVNAAQGLLDAAAPDVIFAEPVGSCTDLNATVLRPLEQIYGGLFRVAPLTVLVEPQRAEEMQAPDADPLLRYLFDRQMQEADLVCFSKCDLAPEVLPALEGIAARRVSALSGEGMDAWLAEVLQGSTVPARRLLDIDYATYAAAEAALGWLNWSGTVRPRTALSPSQLIGPLLDRLDEDLTRAGIGIAHLKALDRASTGFLKASSCRNGEEPNVDGDLLASPSRHHELILNLRAAGDPAQLRAIVESAMNPWAGQLKDVHLEAFRPSPPRPEHRVTAPAGA